MAGVMMIQRRIAVPAMALALCAGVGLAVLLLSLIVPLSAFRESARVDTPPLVVDLVTWRPAVPQQEKAPADDVAEVPKPVPKPQRKPMPPPVVEPQPEPLPAVEPLPPAQPLVVPEPVAETAPIPVLAEKPLAQPQPQPDDTLPEPVPVFRLTEMPRFVHRQPPVYPQGMRALGKSGVVKLEAFIDSAGRVRRITILESAGEAFDEAAKAAIMQSTFAPGKVNDRPVAVLLRLPVKFRLL